MNEETNLLYYNEMHYFCLKNCFNQYMHMMGIENGILKLRIGLEFKMKLQENNREFNVLKHTLLLPFYDSNQVFSGKGDCFEDIFRDNLLNLPVIVLVDVFCLPYRKEYQKYHASHAILLCGYCEISKNVSITDWYKPYFYRGDINYEDYKNARASINPKDINPFSGFAIENYWYKIKQDFFIDNKSNMCANILSFCGNKKLETSNVLVGIDAVRKITEIIENWLHRVDTEYKHVCNFLHDELFIWVRAADLSSLYFQLAYIEWPQLIDSSILENIKYLRDKFSKINLLLLKGSCFTHDVYLSKALLEWKEIENTYIKCCKGFSEILNKLE